MSEIVKIIDETETQKNNKKTKTNKDRKEQGGQKQKGDSKRVRAKWFFRGFKLGFLQLTCKPYIIFKPNLEFALPIILLQRESHESKHVAVECRCLKIWDLLSFWYDPQSQF